MTIHTFSTNGELSAAAANEMIQRLQSEEKPLICVASGDSPAGLYKELVKRVKENGLDVSHWKFVGLDEWAGMNGEDEGSCRYHLNAQFFHPLKIEEERICFFDGRASDLQKECDRVEDFISENGGLDIAILGLGLNGHIGMNEPGTAPHLGCHIADIALQTQEIGQKYFTKPQSLTHGLSLGIANIVNSKNVFLIVNGARKAEIVQKVLKEKISENLPATFLRNHAAARIYLDADAAKFINTSNE